MPAKHKAEPPARDLNADLAPDAAGHYRLHLYAVVSRLIANLAADDASKETYPFLGGYSTALAAYTPPGLPPLDTPAWWDARLVAWEAAIPGHLPLRALTAATEIDATGLRVLMAAGLVEDDLRFGVLFAALQEPPTARRPCIGLLGWLLGNPNEPGSDFWPACRTLIDQGLLVVDNREAPRAEWTLRVPPAIWDAVRGASPVRPVPGLVFQPATSFPTVADLILDEGVAEQVARLSSITAEEVTAFVIRGMTGSGRRTILGSIARTWGRATLLREVADQSDATRHLLGPLATLSGAMPVIRVDPGPGETVDLPTLTAYRGPVGITLGRSGGLAGPLLEQAISISLTPPDRAARRRFWEAGARPLATDLDEVVDRFLLTGGQISRVAGLAASHAAIAGRPAATAGDVRRAARTLNRQSLETLATPLDPAGGWGDLVLGPATSAELRSLELRCRQREDLPVRAGPAFARDLNRGVRAMFTGPSGTGKTLAARALAGALEMDLYRVDLAAVVNKYIGETERNLNQVLSRAEELDVVLLLDEGDALMTKRTEVKNANDRYANLETNYLLQRLETYEGIVIVTTNAGRRIDSAFLRRLDVVIDFASPGVTERRLIWRGHLPTTHAVEPHLLDEIAARCVLTGGQIRNAALHATLLASSDEEQVTGDHLYAALRREYRKAGASYPLAPPAAATDQLRILRTFAGRLD